MKGNKFCRPNSNKRFILDIESNTIPPHTFTQKKLSRMDKETWVERSIISRREEPKNIDTIFYVRGIQFWKCEDVLSVYKGIKITNNKEFIYHTNGIQNSFVKNLADFYDSEKYRSMFRNIIQLNRIN